MKLTWFALTLASGWVGTHAGRLGGRQRANGTSTTSTTSRSLQFSTEPITFSDVPIGTVITDQYSYGRGVVFGPDRIFTSTGNYTPAGMSPVLSGTPEFKGDITGKFVYPYKAIAAAHSFSFTTGYFYDSGSLRVECYDPSGVLIHQVVNKGRILFERIDVKGGDIASFRIGIDRNGPYSYVIDNFISTFASSSIIFRELRADSKDGSWGQFAGFDHVALNYDSSVYESHPGYRNGEYVDVEPIQVVQRHRELDTKTVQRVNGVQNQHTRGSFRHNSLNDTTTVVVFRHIMIDDSQALAMVNAIKTKVGTAGFVGFYESLGQHPNIQKGQQFNRFSGCGLTEWAAEQAGINGGQGFIPNALEQITTPNGTFPLLSPTLLYYAMQHQTLVFNATQAIKAYFESVDYVVTDPLGRRAGVFNFTRLTEMPTVFATPRGKYKYLVITDPIPGVYTVTLYGLPGELGLAVLEASGLPAVRLRTNGTAARQETVLQIPMLPKSRGDVNADGIINQADITALKQRVPTFVNGFANTGDINGDGVLNATDVDLLSQYVANHISSGILFRELRSDAQDGSWGPSTINIPGFDHVALNVIGSVYESHPGYRNGPIYVSADGTTNRTIPVFSGVQNFHSRETFRHNSRNASTVVVNFTEVPINNSIALAMRTAIASKVGMAGFLGFGTVEELVATHRPVAQKGQNNTFTGCGLIEWAAEQAGVNGGQGFIPNAMEAIVTPDATYPLLSPQLLHDAIQYPSYFVNVTQFIIGYFDPVNTDFRDPVGNRRGTVNRTQYRNEIPNAIGTRKGDVETIVIANPPPGTYTVRVMGIKGQKGLAAIQASGRPAVTATTTGESDDEVVVVTVTVPVVLGSKGDVNLDGLIDTTDLTRLQQQIPAVVADAIANTADMDSNGQLNQVDVDLLSKLLQHLQPTQSPTPAPVVGDKCLSKSSNCPSTLLFPRRIVHRKRATGCEERCFWRFLANIKLRLGEWECGPC